MLHAAPHVLMERMAMVFRLVIRLYIVYGINEATVCIYDSCSTYHVHQRSDKAYKFGGGTHSMRSIVPGTSRACR